MALLNYIIYISFYVLLHLLVEVTSQTTISGADVRIAHTATFINDKLYILGGGNPPFNESTPAPRETFLYLDCSSSFSTSELRWVDLSNNSIVPPHVFAAAAKGGANNDILFSYGGGKLPGGDPIPLVYAFNTKTNAWSVPVVTGESPSGILGITPVVDNNGLIYLFGGALSGYGPFTNEMFILDTINLSWKIANSINAPKPRVEYGAVILPDKNIIYMGGLDEHLGMFKLNEVHLYDTTNDIWTTKSTNGSIPSRRGAFSSVLGLDGQRIIIFGGIGGRLSSDNLVNDNVLYVLDLSNFNWYTPKVTGNTLTVSCAFHKAVLIGNYMVITFGVCNVQRDILLLDINNNDEYIWTTNFVPLPPASPPSVLTLPTSLVLGFKIVSILLTIGSFLFYKWYKNSKKQNNAMQYYQSQEKQVMIKV